MNQTLFSNLLSDLWGDLHDPSVLWQIGTIVVCFMLAWGLARMVRSQFAKQGQQPRAVRLGVESFSRVLSPLFAVGLIAIAKLLLARWQHVNLLRVALPLLASFALIRLVFHILRRIFVRHGRAGSFLLLF
jgi:small-conductance mechanosensitive channel